LLLIHDARTREHKNPIFHLVSEIFFLIPHLLLLSSLAETQGHLNVPNAVATHADMTEATDFRLRFTVEDSWEAEARILNPCPCVLITDTEHVNEINPLNAELNPIC
jgi:hypothetical protein